VPGKAATRTRELILDTARKLLRRFGQDKLTVVDIARELGMSHANVYRYFTTKSAILDAIIDEWLSRLETFVDAIVQRPDSAAQRIEAVVVELHRKRKKKLLEDAQVFETYRRVVEIRPDMAARRRQQLIRVFRSLLEEGIRTGEFAPMDASAAAVSLKDATALFLHPLMIPTNLHEETEERARSVVRCMLAGFASAKRPKAPRRHRSSTRVVAR
jgi:AcrR family transcriptional regulator